MENKVDGANGLKTGWDEQMSGKGEKEGGMGEWVENMVGEQMDSSEGG